MIDRINKYRIMVFVEAEGLRDPILMRGSQPIKHGIPPSDDDLWTFPVAIVDNMEERQEVLDSIADCETPEEVYELLDRQELG